MTPDDWAKMQDDLVAIRDDNVVSVVLRRGATMLAAQPIRIAQAGRQSAQLVMGELEARLLEVTILGSATLNIEPGDRFTVDGVLFEVTVVAPNRHAGIRARAKMVQ